MYQRFPMMSGFIFRQHLSTDCCKKRINWQRFISEAICLIQLVSSGNDDNDGIVAPNISENKGDLLSGTNEQNNGDH